MLLAAQAYRHGCTLRWVCIRRHSLAAGSSRRSQSVAHTRRSRRRTILEGGGLARGHAEVRVRGTACSVERPFGLVVPEHLRPFLVARDDVRVKVGQQLRHGTLALVQESAVAVPDPVRANHVGGGEPGAAGLQRARRFTCHPPGSEAAPTRRETPRVGLKRLRVGITFEVEGVPIQGGGEIGAAERWRIGRLHLLGEIHEIDAAHHGGSSADAARGVHGRSPETWCRRVTAG